MPYLHIILIFKITSIYIFTSNFHAICNRQISGIILIYTMEKRRRSSKLEVEQNAKDFNRKGDITWQCKVSSYRA